MLRALFTLGFLLFLAAAGVWFYRNHWGANAEEQQAEARPEPAAPPRAVPAPTEAGPDAAPAQPQPQPQPQLLPPTQPAQERPVAGPSPVAPPPVLPPPATPRVGKKTHVVAPGETLWVISRRYFGTPAYVEAIADANHMDAPNRLQPGMVLVLPDIPGVPARNEEVAQPARNTTTETHQQHSDPMPPTLSRTVRTEP